MMSESLCDIILLRIVSTKGDQHLIVNLILDTLVNGFDLI